MNSKTTLVLVVVLAICTGYVVYVHTDLLAPRGRPDAPKEDSRLFPTALGAAKALEIAAADGTTIVFRKEKDWRIVEPIRAKAEAWKVDRIYDAVRDLTGRAADDAGVGLTGLDKPLWTLKLTDDEGVTCTLQVGQGRPLSPGQTYVRPAGADRTYVVREDFASKLAVRLREYRDKTVLDLSPDEIVRVVVQGRENYELTRHKDAWGLVAPVSAKADKTKVDSLLDKFARLTVNEFVADAPKDLGIYGLAEGTERLVVRVWLKPAEPAPAPATTKPAKPPKPGAGYGVALGRRRGDDVYGRLLGEPGVFRVDAGLLDDLQPKLLDIREKKLLDVDTGDVIRAELRLPGGHVGLVRKNGDWRMSKPFAGRAADKAVDDLLDKLTGLKAADFRDDVSAPARFGLDKPRARITLHLSGKDQTVGLLVGSGTPSGEMTFVRAVSGKAVAVVATSDVSKLLAGAAEYWDRSLLKLPGEARITRILLARTDGTFELERDKLDAWRLTAPLAAKTETAAVEKIVGHLEDLTASKIVALGRKTPKKYAQADEIIRVKLTAVTEPASAPAPTTAPARPATQPATKPAAPKPKTYSLRVVKVDGKSYAWVEGRKIVAVGEAASGLYDDLSAEVRDRKVLGVAGDEIENIRILTGKDVFELRRKKDAWEYTLDKYVRIDEAKVKDYLKQFADLKASKFATHKAPDPSEVKKFGLDAPQMSVELRPRRGAVSRLVVAATGPDKVVNRYATATGTTGVFVLTNYAVLKMAGGLDDFKK